MAIALSGDAKIYYEVHGSGPAVLFVHGSGGYHAAWWQQVAALSPEYTVITIDLRGFGNSRWESDHDARNFPGDIIAVLAGERDAVLSEVTVRHAGELLPSARVEVVTGAPHS